MHKLYYDKNIKHLYVYFFITIFIVGVFYIMFQHFWNKIDYQDNLIEEYKKELNEKKDYTQLKIEIKNLENKYKSLKNEKNKLKNQLNLYTFVNVSKETLEEDLKKYKFLSDNIQKEILEAILETSKLYDINPLILYAMCSVESEFQFWLEHKEVLTTTWVDIQGNIIKKKKRKVKAVGIGGIIWEIWGKDLKENKIANRRTELFYPSINIKSMGYIYNHYFQMERKDNTNNQDESAQRRYFGGNFKFYTDRINTKIVSLVNAEIYRKNKNDTNKIFIDEKITHQKENIIINKEQNTTIKDIN